MMKKYFLLGIFSLFALPNLAQVTLNVYDNVLFYDGYATLVTHPTPPNVVRLRNDLFTKKLAPETLSQIGTELTLNVSISAACDNYDRIGNVNLALVPKGATTYDLTTTSRIEIGRFITPFMNKNVPPNIVPYTFNINHIAKILKDTSLNELYDFWLEFEVFGVPYAAQTQISGCSGRNDVFFGTVNFVTNTTIATVNNTYVKTLNFKKILNDYQAGASDGFFQTVRTITFNLPTALNNAKFYLITSNHGANAGGEEYNRRQHYIYFNTALIHSYLPGEPTCEPYRIYNTQGNGIYGSSPMTNEQWQSFSNWCPGAVIPTRVLDLGNLAAGNHVFKIAVPDAVFPQNEGYIPVSLHIQGETTNLETPSFETLEVNYFPNPTQNKATISSQNSIETVEILDIQGKIIGTENPNKNVFELDLTPYQTGVYFLKAKSGTQSKLLKIIKM